MTRRLWGIGTSRTFRPHWMLHELELPYETREVITRTPSMEDPEFQRLNQRGKIPLLEDGGLVIGESGAILFYLADRHRERVQLAPQPATSERAGFDDLCLYTLTELDAPLYVIRRHEGLASVYGEAPAACQAARAYFTRQVKEIERRLADGRPHLLGDAFGAADILVMSCLEWAASLRIPLDAFDAYRGRLRSRPAYMAAFRRNFTPEALAALAASA
jgi:glutathione S-transferase